MSLTETLAAISEASKAVTAAIGLLEQHRKTLDGIYAAVQEHQKQIAQQGPAEPAGPIKKG